MDSGFRGYLETKDQEQETGSRHVEADGDEAGKRREQVEEKGLVQALQEMVELAEHALQGPARVGRRHGQPGPQAPLPPSTPSMERRGLEATYLPTATKSYLYCRKLLMPRMVRASTR